MDFEDLLKLVRALDQHAVEYVLVGGVALSLHGFVIDLISRLGTELRFEDVEAEQVLLEGVRVQRFRDFDDARRALWADAGAPDLSQRIRRLWAFSARLVPRRAPCGVRRFRSLEEAARDRSSWGTTHPGSG